MNEVVSEVKEAATNNANDEEDCHDTNNEESREVKDTATNNVNNEECKKVEDTPTTTGVAGGAVAGIAIGCFVAGLLVMGLVT